MVIKLAKVENVINPKGVNMSSVTNRSKSPVAQHCDDDDNNNGHLACLTYNVSPKRLQTLLLIH